MPSVDTSTTVLGGILGRDEVCSLHTAIQVYINGIRCSFACVSSERLVEKWRKDTL